MMENETLSPVVTSIETSSEITELASALATAQSQIAVAKKDSVNPHFRSSYADLASCWEACRDALTKNSLSIVQIPSALGKDVTVTTMLLHKSGQFIRGALTMTAQQNTPQAIGSCITYARRYALTSFVGIAPDDDDGNAATQSSSRQQQQKPAQTKQKQADSKKAPTDESRHDKLIKAFAPYEVDQQTLEAHVGKSFKKFTGKDFDKCLILFGELKAGNISPDEIPAAQSDKAKLDQVFHN